VRTPPRWRPPVGLGANLTLVLLMKGKDTAECWNSGILKTRSAGFQDSRIPRFQDSIFAYVLPDLFSLVATAHVS
jgi:hypothetical protein